MNSQLLLAGSLAIASLASGAGFTILEQSVSGIGNAFAGGSAAAEDASTMFYNPAGMTYVSQAEVQGGVHYLELKAKFKNDGTTTLATNTATTGGNADGGFQTPVPNFYFLQPLTRSLTAGLSVNTPFGLSTDFGKEWVGRYMACRSKILTVDISPNIAWKATDKLSLGLGIDCDYVDANLSNAIDLNGDGTPAYDGFSNLKADDKAVGYHLGAIYQFTPSTRVGISYRSQIRTHLEGTADFTLPSSLPGALAAAQYVFVDQKVGAQLTLPQSASISVFHNLNDKVDLMADITWTDWSSFKYLDIKFDNALTESVAGKAIYENWQDTFRYSIGASYKLTNKLKLRAGTCYDSNAVRSSYYRSPRIPDASRVWLATGLGWQVTERSSLDFAYVHIFVSDPDIDNSIHTKNQHLVGTISADMNIVSASYTYTF